MNELGGVPEPHVIPSFRSFPMARDLLGGCLGLLLANSLALAQGPEVLPASEIGSRGVVFALEDPLAVLRGQPEFFGDFNGDGFSDLCFTMAIDVGLQGTTFFSTVIYGRSGLSGVKPLDANFTFGQFLTISQANWLSAGPLGDLDGDGLSDLYVGVTGVSPNDPAKERDVAMVVYGDRALEGAHSPSEIGSTIRGVVLETSDPAHSSYGRPMINMGDFNGDGEADLARPVPYASPQGRAEAGVIYLLYRSRALPPRIDLDSPGMDLPGTLVLGRGGLDRRDGDHLGTRLRALGDVNGDGLDDLGIALRNPKRTILILLGRRSPPPVIDLDGLDERKGGDGLLVLRGPKEVLEFGEGHLTGLRDLNGDGYMDFAVGLSRHGTTGLPGTPPIESRVHLIYGKPDLPEFLDFDAFPPGVSTVIHGADLDFFGEGFGSSLAAGDVNGDGIPDILIGASGASPGGNDDMGEAYVIFGKKDLPEHLFVADGFDGYLIRGEATEDRLGSLVAPLGDFNGDGAPDFMVENSHVVHNPPGPDRMYVIYGRGTAPAPLTITEASPPAGPLSGGTPVILHGTGFRGSPRVLFGGTASPEVTVINVLQVRAVTPAGISFGPVDVEVTVGGETQVLAGGFEYTPEFPVIDLASLGTEGCAVEGDRFGVLGMSPASGDLDGDGDADLAIDYRTSDPASWKVLIIHGGPGLPSRIDALTPSSHRTLVFSSLNPSANREGIALAVLGDVDADGKDDLGIGVGGGPGYLLFGGATLPPELDLDVEVASGRAVRIERHGITLTRPLSFAPLGDLGGDGYADFAVGIGEAPRTAADLPLDMAGEVLFLNGGPSWPAVIDLGLRERVHGRVSGSEAGQRLGDRIVAAGDVNGDGWVDLLAVEKTPGRTVIHLLPASFRPPFDTTLDDYPGTSIEMREHRFLAPKDIHLAPAGDVDGDGLGDFLLGDEEGGRDEKGLVYLIRGKRDLLPAMEIVPEPIQPDGILRIRGAGRQAGRVGPAGDFNEDGFADFLVAEYPFSPLRPGSFYLLFGRSDLPEAIDLARPGRNGIRIDGRHTTTRPWLSRQLPGDLNGDGVGDLVLSEASNISYPGAVYLVFGPSAEFIRGDANRDGSADLTDAVAVLGWLFLGNRTPLCEDGADADDDGLLSLTDPIYLLTHLFVGGAPPPAPYPDAGRDGTGDGLRCRPF